MPRRPRRTVDIGVQPPFQGDVSSAWLRETAARTLDVALPDESCQLGIVIADDDTLRDLNTRYRGLDEVTDVLSFSTTHQGHWEGEGDGPQPPKDDPFVMPPGEPHHLGEVIISYPQAARQAEARAEEVEGELALLVVHGILHLLGFDHMEAGEEAEMRAKEREVLASTPAGVRTA